VAGGAAALPPLGQDPNPRSRRWQARPADGRRGDCEAVPFRLLFFLTSVPISTSEVEDDGRVEFLRAAAALVESWAFLDWAVCIGPSRGVAGTR
jgi:hypothetical protein